MLQAARQGGAGVLGTLLAQWQQHAPREVILCPCGHRMNSRGRRTKALVTTLGQVPFTTLLLSMRALPPRVLSSGPAPGHRQHQLFAGCAAVDGTGGQPNPV